MPFLFFLMKKVKSKSTGGKNKRAGSSFEREVAKILSNWVYGEDSVIRRHPTSGSEKDYGQGADVSVFQPGYEQFNYFVEVKRGYKTDIFNARKQILEWYNTAKSKNKKNYPIWIIWKILRQGIILATNKPFKEVEELFRIHELFVYNLKDLTERQFKEIENSEN